jgi:hypothetical protein
MSTLKSKPFEIFMDLDTSPVKRFLSNLVRLTDTTRKTGKRFKDAVLSTFGSVLKAVFNPLARATEPEAIITWLENMQPKFQAFSNWWQNNMPRIIAFARDFGSGFVLALQAAWKILEPFLPVLNSLGVTTASVAGTHGVFAGKLAGVLAMLGLVNAATFGLGGSLTGALLPSLISVIGKTGWWGVAIVGVIGAFTLLYTKVGWFKTGVDEILGQIKIFFDTTFYGIGAALDLLGNKLDTFKKNHMGMGLGESITLGVATNPALAAVPGGGLIQGIANGILQSQQPLKNAIDTTIQNSAGRFQEMMEIHSPSRVMAWQGKMLSLGLASGIMAGLPSVANALDNFSVDPRTRIVASATPWLESASAVSTKASKGFSGAVNVYNTINVSGDQSAQQIAEELQRRLPEIIASAMNHAADEVDGGRGE